MLHLTYVMANHETTTILVNGKKEEEVPIDNSTVCVITDDDNQYLGTCFVWLPLTDKSEECIVIFYNDLEEGEILESVLEALKEDIQKDYKNEFIIWSNFCNSEENNSLENKGFRLKHLFYTKKRRIWNNNAIDLYKEIFIVTDQVGRYQGVFLLNLPPVAAGMKSRSVIFLDTDWEKENFSTIFEEIRKGYKNDFSFIIETSCSIEVKNILKDVGFKLKLRENNQELWYYVNSLVEEEY